MISTRPLLVGLTLAALALVLLPAPAQRPAKDALETSIDQALLFLRLMQEKDGAWVVLALRGAHNVGCDVPAATMKQALAYLERCRDPASGGYCYTAGYAPSAACTGTALLVLELAGKDFHRSREALQAGSFLLKR